MQESAFQPTATFKVSFQETALINIVNFMIHCSAVMIIIFKKEIHTHSYFLVQSV